MTLLREKIGDKPARRCDANCYNGKAKKCTCLCGGKNHGVGLAQARRNVREVFVPLIAAAETGVLEAVLHQGDLFEENQTA